MIVRLLGAMILASSMVSCSCLVKMTALSTKRGNVTVALSTEGRCLCPHPPEVGWVNFRTSVSDVHPIWTVLAGGDANQALPLERITYGVEPAGFQEAMNAPPLRPGQRLYVSATGPGVSGSVEVTVAPDGSTKSATPA